MNHIKKLITIHTTGKNCIKSSSETKGEYLINFKEVETYPNGGPCHGNDFMKANVKPRVDGRLYFQFENGHSCVIDHKYMNFKNIS
jgi:hypothetical protein